MKVVSILVIIAAVSLGGCLSASTNAKICADLNLINRTVSGINTEAGDALREWTPKKCVDLGVSGDAGQLTGGISAGVHNE